MQNAANFSTCKNDEVKTIMAGKELKVLVNTLRREKDEIGILWL